MANLMINSEEKRKALNYFLSGVKLQNAGRANEAADEYRRSIKLNPQAPDVYNNLGVVLRSLSFPEAAIICYQKCLSLRPESMGLYSNIGNAHRDLGNYKLSVKYHNKSIKIAPKNPEAYFNLGLALRDLGKLQQSLDAFSKTLHLNPNHDKCKWDQALTLLTMGDYKNGFDQYESRWNLEKMPMRQFSRPQWTGEDISGKKLLVYQEQGFGDMIQFARFIPMVKKICTEVFIEVQPELHSLFLSLEGADTILSKGSEFPDFDFCIPMMSLFKCLKLGKKHIYQQKSYLGNTQNSKQIVLNKNKQNKRVGIVWAGKPSHKNDKNRSCSFKEFLKLLSLKGIDVFSLQKGPRTSDIKKFGCESLITDLNPTIRDFSDTAQLISELDLLISVDTAVAHLGGAMGRPVWLLLPYSPDWRWMRDTKKSLWYPSITLFRQKKPNDWDSVLAEVQKELSLFLKLKD